jgi:hypothetical protein
VRTWLARLAAIFDRHRLDADLDDEVRFHLEMTAREYERRGLSAADAMLKAQRHFGGVLIVVAVLASLVPAFRAVRLNPVTALRE